MGLVSKLLLAPLAPVYGVVALARELERQADEQLYGREAIRRQLTELQADLEAGEITEDEYDAAETELLGRLEAVRRMEREAAP